MFSFDGIKAGMKVRTPVGIGRVTDRAIIPASPDGVMVVLSRKDFTPEAWAAVTPHNDPCVFRIYPPDQVELLDAAVDPQVLREIDAMLPAPDAEVVRSMRRTSSRKPKSKRAK